MNKCVNCSKGKVIKEGLEFYGTSAAVTFELVVCTWCCGKGYTTGD